MTFDHALEPSSAVPQHRAHAGLVRGGRLFIILVLEDSQPSKRFVQSGLREAPSESQVRGLMYQAALGAKHCLDRGVFHRDIKLDNYVINTATKEVKLIDFGCGEVVQSGGCKGTFMGYACPPEYFMDSGYEAEPTTVWSLGIMMYRTVCGRQALPDEDGRLSFDSTVSTEFQDLITRRLAPDPAERATMEEILHHAWFQP
ncbi:hypothetical protein QQF64_035846 [Cirrhinus molitorella]|uniref:non-specific serine/threonine protein kinase n=1 Tax=Cirrhinus molitorella TaxID=172907 RepID=A0ABR3NGW4_9TELE